MSKNSFSFPYDPYGIQINFMDDMQKCFDIGGVGIFESPTGTGKSLSLICGSLTWLTKHRKNMAKQRDALAQEIFKREQEKQTDWVSQHHLVSSLKRRRDEIEDSLHQISLLKDKELALDKPNILRVFYCSRTHSQLTQFIDQFKMTDFSGEFRLVTVASRQQLCLNEEIRNLPSLNRRCIEIIKNKTCPYYKASKSDLLTEKICSRPLDVEDMFKAGKETGACPFYAARESVDYAELLVVPYSILLHEQTRLSYNLDLSGQIVIIDEAHNLMEAISSIYSAEIPLSTALCYSEMLGIYNSKYSNKLSSSNVLSIKKIIFFVDRLIAFMKKMDHKQACFTLSDFMYQSGLVDVRVAHLATFLEHSLLTRKLSVSKGEDMDCVDKFVDCIAYYDSFEDGRIILSTTPVVSIKYILLNPAARFIELATKAHSLVFAGGTLRPYDEIKELISLHTNKKLIEHCSSHVSDSQNSLLLAVGIGPGGMEIKLNYSAQKNDSHVRQVCSALVNLSRVVPRGGIVCFFPSYEFEERCHAVIKQQFGDFLRKKRKLFREPKISCQVDQVLRDYGISPSESILFCVIGGKLSEGINFRDDLCRLVVVVGVPFPNVMTEEWKAKMDYIKNKDNSDRITCMRAVNQSIGRAIRHKNDFAAIVLLDSRYGNSSLSDYLPSWLMRNHCIATSFPHALTALRNFFILHKDSY
ncbi:ATP-dependent DNA helicase DDX11-like [Octopus sinensis]|uniref:ATP-dependent DNA helicase DDX11-like n=1 Tax=Octopus sinensis TaxID=2607531 RepID=A0A6P7TYF1_9MOLL|nr:ATP-dependent DNA helicase DDX11-like [Octopus sinensis]